MRFGSVCSGIEAASVAWEPLGWTAAWLAEVDMAASAVLAHRLGATAPKFPLAKNERFLKRVAWGERITNWGDMTRIPDLVRIGAADAPDVLCGGTPCQSYSIAGRRQGLSDDRGQLTLKFVELADAIDEQRLARGEQPCVVFWENVPGVLSSKDNAFGCFLADLAGEDMPLEPPGGRWKNAGLVLGPKRAVAWRTFDAQYFNLAQRRARMFVVASAREGFDPGEVLFEFDGVRRDTPPSREAGQDAAGTLAARADGGGFPGTDEACSGYVQPVGRPVAIAMAHGQGGAEISEERCPTLTCNHEAPIVTIPILEAGARTGVSTNDPRAGLGVGGNHDPMFTLQAGKQHGVALSVALRGRDGGATAELGDELAGTLRASTGGGDKPYVLDVLPFDTTHITSPQNGANPQWGNPCHSLSAGGHPPACIDTTMAVRRLMPVECERLQGFPDGWTEVPVGGKPAADGPRYKQLGNSWAVPVVRWIGARIDAHVAELDTRDAEHQRDLDGAFVAWLLAA